VLTIFSARNQVNAPLASYFHSLLNARKEKKKKQLPFIIPPEVARDIIKDPFTGEGSQGPSDHLYKLEARCFCLNYLVYFMKT
jgi:hypothetical protein